MHNVLVGGGIGEVGREDRELEWDDRGTLRKTPKLEGCNSPPYTYYYFYHRFLRCPRVRTPLGKNFER